MAPQPVTAKACTQCGEVKDRSEFYQGKRHDEGRTRNSLTARCKVCAKDYLRWKSIKTLYGLNKEQYMAMLEAQNGTCAICQKVNSKGAWLAVDHCHTTKKVRGLLCQKCNIALGQVNDNPAILAGMIAYLITSSED